MKLGFGKAVKSEIVYNLNYNMKIWLLSGKDAPSGTEIQHMAGYSLEKMKVRGTFQSSLNIELIFMYLEHRNKEKNNDPKDVTDYMVYQMCFRPLFAGMGTISNTLEIVLGKHVTS